MVLSSVSPNISRKIFIIGTTLLFISPAFALGDGARNLLLIIAMGISPILFLFYPIIKIKTDLPLIIFILMSIFFPLLNHPESMRWSTVLYGCMFVIYFMTLTKVLYISDIDADGYLRFLKVLIFAYFIVLVIQQICVLTGLPILNVSNYNPETPWKLNSLMSEPEHSGRMMAILMYSYLTIKENVTRKVLILKEEWRDDKGVWIAFLWSMITMMSAGAYLFLLIVLFKFFNRKTLFSLLILLSIIIVIVRIFEIDSFMRTYRLAVATFSFDMREMVRADHSGALRIIPAMVCFDQINLASFDGWFGKGIDFISTIMSKSIWGVQQGYTGGGLLLYAVEYGFLPFILITLFSFKICYDTSNKIASIAFWFFSVFLTGINLQITWAVIMLFYTNKEILKRCHCFS
ncbi:hypothetical protein [Coprobacter fastidiosus]|jgi:hypothetical protein|uniref:O-antigen ligase-like membrane protein n=1 Tax=Coprobacter fastidiosus NSB1 = JCM 33896 TaxID=1349822 RepID=A0A495WJ82_9BACT|nr:hypothetical protein [Coprobacter fastidiosus]ERM88334.1 hypothetical protein NSB1T_14065 [Coprobacter fastidiosus NSB1 = JCM 33896]MBS6269497.1 hypothetical protein [Tannerella sp.]RKT61439.1 hypothetical protein BC742_0485 [Coprobacter fastidiosus NSB1 = JCM 33896]